MLNRAFHKSSLIPLLTLIGLALLVASPAAALTKHTTIIDLDEVSVIPAGELCSFDVTVEQGPGQIKVDEFFDASGNITKAIVTNYGGAFHETVSANGVTLSTVQTFSDFIYFNPDGSIRNAADAGINFVFTLPHQGVVSVQVGLIKFDSNFNPIFTAGPGFRTSPDTDALCTALS
jgi:hypothetical protein